MTIRPWNDRLNNERASGAADAAVVLILKKTQGSVWSEAGRTPLCPTIGWLRETYGDGQYELRLKLGNRILCMANANCAALPSAALSSAALSSAALSSARLPSAALGQPPRLGRPGDIAPLELRFQRGALGSG